jgi:hypothetical protein
MDARFAMWVHGVSFFPERTAGDAGGDGPLVQVREWVDGPGVPFSDITGLHQGSGVTFRGKRNHDNWFHVAIPTPVIVPVYQPASQHYNQGQRIRLEKVFVLFKNYISARGGALARIREVHVWDGAQTRYDTIVVPPSDPNLSADNMTEPTGGDLPPDPEPLSRDPYQGNHHMQIQPGWNAWTLTSGGQPIKPVLMWGVGISVLVHFADEIDILFAAAGADFLLEVP